MRIVEENWKVLASLFPARWQQMAWQSGAVERLRAFPSPDVLLRMLMLHVARGYSLRETVVRAKLANWANISDVALLKRLRNSEEWLRCFVCRIASGKPRVPTRRSYQSDDPDCGWHDRQRARQDREPMADSVQHQIAGFGV
jgi:hypothetical protein